MSHEIRVQVGETAYPVRVGEGIVDTLGAEIRERLEADRALVVIDAKVAGHHGQRVRRAFHKGDVKVAGWVEVPSGERAKSLTRARRLYDAFLDAGVDRWTPVVAVGGGVTGDLAGFAASTFLRGVPLVHVPTTVVAQVDSSVGGKTAVNFAGAKNLVGTFYQPALVLCDPGLLATLGGRDYRAGLAEAVKIGVTLRPDLMERMEEEVEALAERDPEVLTPVVHACVAAKGEVVGRDEREQDVRAILNYGHTVGHAVEAAASGRLRHGEAVAVGMNAAAWIGEALGVSFGGVRERQNGLLERLGLKITAGGVDKGLVLRKLKLDKKVRARKTRFVLTLQIGGASVWPHISRSLVRDAVGKVLS